MTQFDENENVLVDMDEKLSARPEFKKMLNNLLGIGNRDNAIFASSRVNNIDLENLLSANDYKKIFANKTFAVEISNMKTDTMIDQLALAENVDEFIEVIDENNSLLSIADRKLLENDFEESKSKIITKQKKQKNQKISKWKRFRNKYLDKQAQTNSWPLYIGAMFIKVKTVSSTIYAPLLMKKVEIQITNTNKVKIVSMDDSVDVNEKALFLLQNEYKFNLPKLLPDESYSLEDVIEEFSSSLEDMISNDFDFKGKFDFLTKKEVKNQNLMYAKGAVLTITSPSGGALRDKLIDLLKTTDLDELLDIDMMKDLDAEINRDLENGEAVFRINETDFSQEKAILGSLKDNSIIWGPPGTGKSQTITNIIANILYRENTAIITSEKKAALDVIQKRMGSLSKYMYFGLTDKNVDKEAFYKPFNDLVDAINRLPRISDREPTSLITSPQLMFLKQKYKLKDVDLEHLARVKNIINANYAEQAEWLYDQFDLLRDYSKVISVLNKTPDIESALAAQGIVKKGFVFKRYSHETKMFISILEAIDSNQEFLEDFISVNDINLLRNLDNYILVEDHYRLKREDFSSDEEFLDKLLAAKFRSKLQEMQLDEVMKKKVTSFLKNCKSGFRIPYKFASIHNDVIKELFNVYVSTPQTLASIIEMDKSYDYVIFDEASQLHLEKAIPFLSLGDKAIIAGDNQQMRPTSYFGVRDKTEMIDDSEANVDSLLDYAYRKGLKAREYMLTKNYRSKSAELMMFSSKEFYEGNLDVIDNKEFINQESIEVFNAKGKWEGRVNAKEATLMLDKLMEEKDNFKKIILLTLNSTQKQYVESLIYNEEKYSEVIDLLKEERVFLRNLENIQGDEADLVIVSVAYDKSASLGATYVAKPEGKNALNVAISRAVEKMIVFKSISSDEVKGNSKNDSMRVFREWLAYLESSSEERTSYGIDHDRKSEKFDSTFEEDVYDEIVKGIKLPSHVYIRTQFPVGSYSVDMVLMNSKTNKFLLGIEVDGYKYHSGFVKMTKDFERQAFIESKGYSPIYRITELNWRINKEKTLEEIKRLISSKI